MADLVQITHTASLGSRKGCILFLDRSHWNCGCHGNIYVLMGFFFSKIFSETTRPTALIFDMWQWLMVHYIDCANHAPGFKFGHVPGVDSLHRLPIGKHSNINISKASRLILIKLYTQHHWAIGGLHIVWGQIRVELWFPWQHIGLNGKKIFFSDTTRPTALIFSMWQWLMDLHMNCAIHAPGVKFGHAQGGDSLHRLTTIGKPSNSPTFLMQVKLSRFQVSVYRTIGPLVKEYC